MTSIDRVKATLLHKEPDWVPFEIGATNATGINIIASQKLRNYFGFGDENNKIVSELAQTGCVENDLIEMMGIDAMPLLAEPPIIKKTLEVSTWKDDTDFYKIDEFGVGWKMPVIGGSKFILNRSPLANVEDISEVDSYPWPDASLDSRYKLIENKSHDIVDIQKKACIIGGISDGLMQTAINMLGFQKFYCDLYLNEKLISAVLDKMLKINISYWDKVLEVADENTLVAYTSDNLAGADGLLFPMSKYKNLIYPYHKELFSFIKKKSKNKIHIFYHTCGDCRDAIPLLVDAGVDILNPVEGMSAKDIKREYGKDLSFWGGACSSKDDIINKTPQQVADMTKQFVEDMMCGGGYVAAPLENISYETPIDNIIAMWETLKAHGKY